ncbi:MAG: hypothetical protein ACK4OJ_06225 [Brevundimonas sp.]
MNPFKRWKRWRAKVATAKVVAKRAKMPLREFVYLDEVSLRSLLSSQKGEITDTTSQQLADTVLAEAGGKASVDAQVAKAELTSRFQTTNSSTLQTSKKATVQSWFRELHGLPGLRLIEAGADPHAAPTVTALLETQDPSVLLPVSRLGRGELVEFRVKLSADPVFHLGTLVSEFSGMADDFPDMFSAKNADETLREMLPINKILQRLLAGLIPVRGLAVDYRVVRVEDVDYVVHEKAVAALGLESRALEVVGVTEHLAYWKDIRRVLFSHAEFTVLSRVARPGLHDSWTPVKLADLFRQLAPDLVEQINAAGRLPFMTPVIPTPTTTDIGEARMVEALRVYASAALEEAGIVLVPETNESLEHLIQSVSDRHGSVSDQRSAFVRIGQWLSETVGVVMTAAEDLKLRDRARIETGLSLFPALAASDQGSSASSSAPVQTHDEARVLDVEIIAIYW